MGNDTKVTGGRVRQMDAGEEYTRPATLTKGNFATTLSTAQGLSYGQIKTNTKENSRTATWRVTEPTRGQTGTDTKAPIRITVSMESECGEIPTAALESANTTKMIT